MGQFTQVQKRIDPVGSTLRWNHAMERSVERNARSDSAQRPQPAAVGRFFLKLTKQLTSKGGAGCGWQMLEAGKQTPALVLQLGIQSRARLLAANTEISKVVP